MLITPPFDRAGWMVPKKL